MSVLFIALPVALLMGGAALVACIGAIRGGQFDDLDAPAMRMLIEDHPVEDEPLDDHPVEDAVTGQAAKDTRQDAG